MARFSSEVRIGAPPERVFAVFADIENAPRHVEAIDSVEILTGAPVGAGTRWKETRRVMNRSATEELEMTAFEPGRSYTVSCDSHGTLYTSVFRFEPWDQGTRVTLDFEARPHGLAARLLSPLGRAMIKTVARAVENDFHDLKKVIETAPETRPASS